MQTNGNSFFVFGRVILTTPAGVELEGDDKHVEKFAEEWVMTECNPVATPYVKPTVSVHRAVGDEAKTMSLAEATLYRRAAARINYVAGSTRSELRLANCFKPHE